MPVKDERAGGVWWLRRFVPSSTALPLSARRLVLSLGSHSSSHASAGNLQALPHPIDWGHRPKPNLVQEYGNCSHHPNFTFRVCPCGRPLNALECVSTFHSQALHCGRPCPFSPSGRSPRMLVGACLFLSLLVAPWQSNVWPSFPWGMIMRLRSTFLANKSLLIGSGDNADRLGMGLGDCEPPYPLRRSATAWHPEGCVSLVLSAVDDDRTAHVSQNGLARVPPTQLRVSVYCRIHDPAQRHPYEDGQRNTYRPWRTLCASLRLATALLEVALPKAP